MSGHRSFRSSRVPPTGMFILIDSAKAAARAAGVQVIDLSVGASDMAVPKEAIDALRTAVDDASTHRYCLKSGTLPLLQACTTWFSQRYNVQLDPSREALSLVGSLEGLAHLLMAVAEPGDGLLFTDCHYPAHMGAAQVSGMKPLFMSLGPDLLPDFDAVSEADAACARVLLLNYPSNPTAAVADIAFFERALAFAQKHDLLLIHDNPYSDYVYDGSIAPSPLTLPNALERCVEIFTFSKSFHMGGFRLGFALGCHEALDALAAFKTPVDFNQYLGIQQMGIACLALPRDRLVVEAQEWGRRAEALVTALGEAGWPVAMPKAGMFLWAQMPPALHHGTDDVAFCADVLRRTGVALAPGSGFGPGGVGHVRIALVAPPDVLRMCAKRIGEVLAAAEKPADMQAAAPV